jgi:hypothetical protein
MVAEEEEAVGDLIDLWKRIRHSRRSILRHSGWGKNKQVMGRVVDDASTSSSSKGNFSYQSSFAHSTIGTTIGTRDTIVLSSISATRSLNWIVDSGASHHVTGAAGIFLPILV